MKRLPKQEQRLILWLLGNHEINPLEAWAKLGIYRLSAVIFKLRQRGFAIETQTQDVMNHYQEHCSVARYVLDRPSEALRTMRRYQ